MDKMKELKITVRQFLTKPSENPSYKDKKPVPMRTMFGYVTKETARGVYVKLKAKPAPSSHCLNCGRTITNSTSLLYGFGSECITKIPYAVPLADPANIEEYLKELQEKMKDITWEGWLPKAHIEMEETGKMIEPFLIEETSISPESKNEPKIDENLVEELYNELISEELYKELMSL